MAYRLAVTEQRGALTAAEGKGTFWKQKSPIDLDAASTAASGWPDAWRTERLSCERCITDIA
jgi:hypothetical protein